MTTILRFFEQLFGADFMPHVYCLREPAIIALHAVSDGLIAVSYFLIPVALMVLVRRRKDLAFRREFLLFGVFILACGATHILGIVTLWHPMYRLEGVVKAVTALASLGTAFLLWRLIPVAVALPGPAQFERELSERRRAEEQVGKLNAELESRVRERTAQMESAHAQMAEFAAALDKTQVIIQKFDGTITYWNSGAQAMYGWSKEDALGQRSHELLNTELPQPLEVIQAELLARGEWSGEFRQRRGDGSEIWVASHWALNRDGEGKPVSVAKVNNDITELRRSRDALRISEATARSLYDNASQGILTADRAGRIVEANPAAQLLFGYRHAELIGAQVEMLLPEAFRSRHVAHRACYTAEPHARVMGQGMDLVARRKDGSEFPVEISLSFVAVDASDGLAMAFISDITSREQASQERESLIGILQNAIKDGTTNLTNMTGAQDLLRIVNESLEVRIKDRTADLVSSNKELAAFAYSISHDLRAPIRHMDGFAELLHRNCYEKMDAEGQRCLDKISSSAELMGHLIDDLLRFSRVSRSDVRSTRVNLNLLLAEVRRELAPDLAGRSVIWTLGELPEVFGDRSMLRQVLINLVSNSVKFTRGRADTHIEIGCENKSQGETTIFVRDNGAGFDMQYADKLFHVFQRLHSDEFEGTGTGLAIVRRIIERHGGRVWAEGAVDRGAAFYFSLPLQTAQPVSVAEPWNVKEIVPQC
jgi:PAS domain S-box-containing protein